MFTATRPPAHALDALTLRLESIAAASDSRVILGIAGSPGSGKTTLAKALVKRINRARPGHAVHLPMDGFHLANSMLDTLGLRDRKGAIETFDGWGFVALLERLRHETTNIVYAPSFRRSVDEGVAGEIAIVPATKIIVAEGNYLLMDRDPWRNVLTHLDAAWFCSTDSEEREGRLTARHMRHGRTYEAALAWARNVDGANAELIEASAYRADLIISGTSGEIISQVRDAH